jgi:hypothetical protein
MVKVKKSVTRESEATHWERGERPIIITIEPRLIGFRLKGARRNYTLPIAELYTLAVNTALHDERKRQIGKKKRR